MFGLTKKQENPLLIISRDYLKSNIKQKNKVENFAEVEEKIYDKVCIIFLKKLNSILTEEQRNDVKETFNKLPYGVHGKIEKMYPYILKGIGEERLNNVLEMVKNEILKTDFTQEISFLKYKENNEIKNNKFSFIFKFLKELFKKNEVDLSEIIKRSKKELNYDKTEGVSK